MRPAEIWNHESVIIETGLRDGVIGAGLFADGVTNYLGVSSDAQRIDEVKASHPVLKAALLAAPYENYMHRNNATVLILSGLTPLNLWLYRILRHSEQIAWKAGWSPVSLLATLGWLFHTVFGRRYGRLQRVTCRTHDGQTRTLFVCKVLRTRSRAAARHFVPHVLGLDGVFKKFEELGVKYAVLRWYEKLPALRPGKDIDMLLADESLPVVRKLLNSQPGIQTTDIYTPSGLPKSDFFTTPYYPTEKAREVLARTVWHKNYCRVLAPRDHFHTLAYHGVYHNGHRSGLKSRNGVVKSRANPKHDYEVILGEMAQQLGIKVELTLEGLHEYLTQVGWAPRPDMLARMAAHYSKNPWVRHLASQLQRDVNDVGLTVYCIRRKAVEWGFTEKVVTMLERSGWKILAQKVLSDTEVANVSRLTRGGNWEKGIFATSAGPPAIVLVCYDPHPIKPTRAQQRKDPRVANARQFVKDEIRTAINNELPPGEQCSSLHSTDYGGEAWYFIEVFMPERLQELRAKVMSMYGPTREVRRAA